YAAMVRGLICRSSILACNCCNRGDFDCGNGTPRGIGAERKQATSSPHGTCSREGEQDHAETDTTANHDPNGSLTTAYTGAPSGAQNGAARYSVPPWRMASAGTALRNEMGRPW